MKKIIFITSNKGKAKSLKNYLNLPIEHFKLDFPEIQSLSLHQIVIDKVKRAYSVVKKPVLVEDTSLVFNALSGLPGPFIKWFHESLGDAKLCKLLDGYEDRTAVAKVEFAFCNDKEIKIFDGKIEGEISKEPKGKSGFGWDSIFIPKGHKITWAEMSEDEKHKTSMRKIAFKKIKEYLDIYY